MSRWKIGFILWFVAAACFADATRDLHLAARSGDLASVKRLIEGGLPADSPGRFGITALSLAAQNGATDVVQYLLEKGADPDARETFFGMSVLEAALWKGAPDYEVAIILLSSGAIDRASALDAAFRSGHVELARAASQSGPVTESEAAELRGRFNGLSDELAAILAEVKTRPDPPPPTYSSEELRRFAGEFEGEESSAKLEFNEGGLKLTQPVRQRTICTMRDLSRRDRFPIEAGHVADALECRYRRSPGPRSPANSPG